MEKKFCNIYIKAFTHKFNSRKSFNFPIFLLLYFCYILGHPLKEQLLNTLYHHHLCIVIIIFTIKCRNTHHSRYDHNPNHVEDVGETQQKKNEMYKMKSKSENKNINTNIPFILINIHISNIINTMYPRH